MAYFKQKGPKIPISEKLLYVALFLEELAKLALSNIFRVRFYHCLPLVALVVTDQTRGYWIGCKPTKYAQIKVLFCKFDIF